MTLSHWDPYLIPQNQMSRDSLSIDLCEEPIVEYTDLKTLVERALEDKVLTRQEQQQILRAVVADQEVTPEEHALLESIIDKINSGEIKAVD